MPAPRPPRRPWGLQHAPLWSPVPTLNGSRVSGQLSRLPKALHGAPSAWSAPPRPPRDGPSSPVRLAGWPPSGRQRGTSRPPTPSSQLTLTNPRPLTGAPLSFQSSPQAALNPVTLSPLNRPLEVKVDTWGLEVGAARLATLQARPGAPPWRTLPRSPTAQHTCQPGWSAQQQGGVLLHPQLPRGLNLP